MVWNSRGYTVCIYRSLLRYQSDPYEYDVEEATKMLEEAG